MKIKVPLEKSQRIDSVTSFKEPEVYFTDYRLS